MKEWQIENSETSEISEISEILFRVFLFPSFRFFPTAKIENSDLKTWEKNFRAFQYFRGFRVFDLAAIGCVGGHMDLHQGLPPREEFKLTFTLGKCLFNLVILNSRLNGVLEEETQ